MADIFAGTLLYSLIIAPNTDNINNIDYLNTLLDENNMEGILSVLDNVRLTERNVPNLTHIAFRLLEDRNYQGFFSFINQLESDDNYNYEISHAIFHNLFSTLYGIRLVANFFTHFSLHYPDYILPENLDIIQDRIT